MSLTTEIPEILYKYRSMNEFALNILTQGEIYFASVAELPDKHEYSNFHMHDSAYVNDGDNKLRLLSKEEFTTYLVNATRNNMNGILSLCESRKEKQMYARYSDYFKGMCIGFDWNKFGLSSADILCVPHKVTYQQNIEIKGSGPNGKEWMEILTSKQPFFSYEKEWRMFYSIGPYSSNNVRNAIKEIIFGHNMTKNEIYQVKGLIKDLSVDLFITKPLEDDSIEILPLAEKKSAIA